MDKIAILDFGAQYTQLIARRIREMSGYSEIIPCTHPVDEVLAGGYKGIVLSGGPSSVYEDGAPLPDRKLFEAGVPVLGICYGMQAMAYLLGGHVVPAERREYGGAELTLEGTGELLDGIVPERDNRITVWMSHGDTVMRPPRGFTRLASTANCPVAAMSDPQRRLFAVQFHPEVAHTPQGKTVLGNFLRACGVARDWSMASFVDSAVETIRRTVGTDQVLCALSGGVDSSVVAVLVHKAIGEQLTCLFVDNGLLRKGEAEGVVETFRDAFKIKLIHVDATIRFREQLRGVIDPETKGQRIGAAGIAVLRDEARRPQVGQRTPPTLTAGERDRRHHQRQRRRVEDVRREGAEQVLAHDREQHDYHHHGQRLLRAEHERHDQAGEDTSARKDQDASRRPVDHDVDQCRRADRHRHEIERRTARVSERHCRQRAEHEQQQRLRRPQ